MIMVAALFVQTGGIYFGVPGVDPWDERRDARKYRGPFPVVAHPPCERWGRYAEGGPSHHGRFKRGDDGGCFESALASVRQYGGPGDRASRCSSIARAATTRASVAGVRSSA